MPDFWQFPTVSMGLGPIMAIYQARFNRYLEHRGLKKTAGQHVWCFMGDGESDEPESLGAFTLASREGLDNLIFVINCNLQRLDGPVRGNGKIIQELEAAFRGAGWNCIKVIWGCDWDPLLEHDKSGLLVKRMGEVVDGEFQKYTVEPAAPTSASTSSASIPSCSSWSSTCPTSSCVKLKRGGHDPEKVYAAYKAAVEHKGSPTVILAHTIKGYGLGEAGEGKNIAHQAKKLDAKHLLEFRNRFGLSVPDEAAEKAAFYKPPEDSRRDSVPQKAPRRPRRLAAGPRGQMPAAAGARRRLRQALRRRQRRQEAVHDHGVFVDMLARLLRDKELGKWIVPIIPDEARTFGMDPFFAKYKIYSQRRPALRAGGRGVPAGRLPRGQERPAPGGGHHRGRLDVVVHRGRHRLRHARRADDPVLHLLLDVRLPADRRPDLGGGRPADARLPAGGDGRPHHAQRRGPAARGRPQPHRWPRRCRTSWPTTRPWPTSWPSSSATASAACTRT